MPEALLYLVILEEIPSFDRGRARLASLHTILGHWELKDVKKGLQREGGSYHRINNLSGFGNPSLVTSLVKRLREKIEPDVSSRSYIRTIHGVGYKLGVKPC